MQTSLTVYGRPSSYFSGMGCPRCRTFRPAHQDNEEGQDLGHRDRDNSGCHILNTSFYEFTEEYIENHNTSMKWVRFRPLQLSPEDPPYDGWPLEGNIDLPHTVGVDYDRVYSLPQGRHFL